jgi:hypothetical protein
MALQGSIKRRTIFSELWELWLQRCQTKKALRYLCKQEWSVEFLTVLLVKAANIAHQPLEMVISNGTTSIRVNTLENVPTTLKDDDIFDHLDDEAKIRQFMEQIR